MTQKLPDWSANGQIAPTDRKHNSEHDVPWASDSSEMSNINNAIQDCLNRCRGSDKPVAALARHVNALRQAGWNETDIRAVETAVVRLLGAISDHDIPIDAR